jgi:23S rRNA pseudouridine2605 synthase
MTAGRVTVNGVVTTELGAKVDPLVDVVAVDGVPVLVAGAPVYLALHKPSGVVTTMSDPQGRPTVATLVPTDQYPGLFPVGRLDFETTGLLLFTTDGELSHRLLHPRWKVEKSYAVLADGRLDAKDIERLEVGIKLDDGLTAPAKARILDHRATNTLAEITITEGRKRQVRRMFSALSHPVIELHRVRFGPVELGMLGPSSWRHLSADEVTDLRRVTEMGE